MKAILDHWVGNRSEDTEHTILVGGQLSLFTEHELVTQEQAFECAVQYFKTGHISHVGLPYTWERL